MNYSLFFFLCFFFISCNTKTSENNIIENKISSDSLIKRGAYLVSIMGCEDCHSPKQMGPTGPEIIADRRFSGFPSNNQFGYVDTNVIKSGKVIFSGDLTAAAGPWGISYAGNISSDETGIGNWSIVHFSKAMREGKWKGMDGSRTLLPPMPWESFKHLNDLDLEAIFSYLKSTRPVNNIVPPSGMPL